MSEENEGVSAEDLIAGMISGVLAGTLMEAEHRQVVDRLDKSQAFRNELVEVLRLKEDVKRAFDAVPGPSQSVLRRVRAKIPNERPPHGPVAELAGWMPTPQPYLGGVGLHRFFAWKWAPPLAILLILGQAVALTWVLGSSWLSWMSTPDLTKGVNR